MTEKRKGTEQLLMLAAINGISCISPGGSAKDVGDLAGLDWSEFDLTNVDIVAHTQVTISEPERHPAYGLQPRSKLTFWVADD